MTPYASCGGGWFVGFLVSLGWLQCSWASQNNEWGSSFLKQYRKHDLIAQVDDCCLAVLTLTSQTCRAEDKPFCITQYVEGTPKMQKYFTMPVEVALDNEAGNVINHGYPGLRPLNARHHVYVVDNFLSPEDRAMMLADARRHKWVQALDDDAHDSRKACNHRKDAPCHELISSASLCRMAVHKKSFKTQFTGENVEQMVQSKINELLPETRHTDKFQFETLQITRYHKGDFYTRHTDGRRVTVLMYIHADMSGGGETTFPRLDLTHVPVPGQAIVFFPMFSDGTHKVSMIHTSEELISGEKVIAQQWIGTPHARYGL
eukprot:CAMPEP_0172810620 /NCGR_PEP_ID=MMETSP1075-20121228/8910_1 /TAXON_ID=2916 /ORGANISM="Ceratium fusus, Strain PA161109" /LENGTH=317 /DNA_ID=CAMNT_0013649951 /DNA_START=3 /DNA_END=956 /DNA_ORIENTATION=-